MSRGPETRFIASIHRLLPDDLYHMKNHNTYVGGPADVWYSGERSDMWIEYKYVAKMPLHVNLIDRKKDYSLSALQEEWLNKRYIEGRNVFVVLGCKEGGIVFKQQQWMHAHTTDTTWKAAAPILSRLEIATWISEITKGKYEAPVKRGKRIQRCV